jgi:hypothetical protein
MTGLAGQPAAQANGHGVSATPENVSRCRHDRFPHPGPLPEGERDSERAARDFHGKRMEGEPPSQNRAPSVPRMLHTEQRTESQRSRDVGRRTRRPLGPLSHRNIGCCPAVGSAARR